jgi:hydroxymethylglutaryl-CoA lyase
LTTTPAVTEHEDSIVDTEVTDTLVTIQEVGLRDGLQNELAILSAEQRAELVTNLCDAGLRRIQIGSFVSRSRVPQMADTDRVWQLIRKTSGIRFSVLVLNERGLEKAISAGVPHVEIFVSASDTHSRRNSNVSMEQALEDAVSMVRTALAEQRTVTAGAMCAFGCHFEGDIAAERVKDILTTLWELGPQEIGLADTTGMGVPEKVRELVHMAASFMPLDRLTLHFHDTYGFGLANLEEALRLGARHFDASVGGLGGCPFVPGATGNISTHRALKTAEALGFSTGIDPDKLDVVRGKLERLLGRKLEP